MKTEQEQKIDRALQSLGTVQPDTAMQIRLLQTLREADADARNTPRTDQHSWSLAARFTWLTQQPQVALAIAFTILSTAVLLRHISQTKPEPYMQHHSVAEGNPSEAHVISAELVPALPHSHEVRLDRVPGQRSFAAITPQRLHMLTPNPRYRQGKRDLKLAVNSYEEATATRTPAASFPPPPLPLTTEEQLLRRFVRHIQTEHVALLTKSAFDAAADNEKNAVTEFFTPLAPLRGQQEPIGYATPAGLQ